MAMIKNKLSPEQLQQRVSASGWATRVQLLGLILVFALWTFWINPPGEANPLVIWLVQSLLLLAFIPSIFSGRPRPHIWLCFVILLYFCMGAVYAYGGSSLGILMTLLSSGIFCSAMLYARWKSLYNGLLQQQQSAEPSSSPKAL
tara:strand:- start:2142 stop:2576 length:435 start_codon:yes stop_codon:yes gene_type:complete